MNHRQLSFRREAPASEAPRSLGAATHLFRESSLLTVVAFALMVVFSVSPAAKAQVIDFPTGFAGQPTSLWLENSSRYSGSSIQINNAIAHSANNVWFKAPVDEQAFTTTFTFHFNCSVSSDCGDGMGFMMICACGSNPVYNPPTNPGYTYSAFSSQNFSWSWCDPSSPTDPGCNKFPNGILVKFDLYNNQTNAPGAEFTGYYTNGELPQYPNPVYDMSGSGINMQSGHQFRATLTYNGSTLVETLTDMATNAEYSHTYQGVNIPAAIGANTAFVGFGGGTGAAVVYSYLDSWTYSSQTPGQVAAPAFSPTPGTYTSPQSVAISDGTSGSSIYYTTDGSTPTTSSTKYTGPRTVNSTEMLKALAVKTGDQASPVASADYTIGSPSSPPPTDMVINYANGFASHPSQIWLENAAVYSGSFIKLTSATPSQANNAWYRTPVNVQAFTTTFTWTADCPAKPARCGDGMGFMVISDANSSSAGFNYSGSSGAQFSWSRCSGPPGTSTDCPAMKSVLVKFDLYNNSTNTDGANLTGFYSGGVYPHENAQPPQPEYNMAPAGIEMQSGHLMSATLAYNGATLMETVTDKVTGATYRNSYSANIPSLVGGKTAYVGFGASSGSADVTQDLKSWTYTSGSN